MSDLHSSTVTVKGDNIPEIIKVNDNEYAFSYSKKKGIHVYYKWYDDKKIKYLVLKTRAVELDVNVISRMEKCDLTCSQYIVPYKKITYNDKDMVLMEYYDGNLKDIDDMSLIYDILLSVVKGLIELADCEIYYIDMKTSNILYRYPVPKSLSNPKSSYTFVIGDLGGATIVDEYKDTPTTYPPFDKRYSKGFVTNQSEKDVSWSVGVLIGLFLYQEEYENEFSNKYCYKYIYNMTEEEHSKNINELIKVILNEEVRDKDTLIQIIKGTLTVKPEDRLSLKEILSMLEK